MKKTLSLILILAAICMMGCDTASGIATAAKNLIADSDERFDLGYDDGYTVGWREKCDPRGSLIEGDWSNEDYTRGYRDGYEAGKKDCRNGNGK